MSSPKHPWWSTARQAVRNYPIWKAELEQLHSQSVTAGEGGLPSGGEASRKTENIALRQLPPAKQREYDSVNRAVEITSLMPDGDRRVEMIRQMYWRGNKMDISAVVYRIGIAEATGKRWHGAFIYLVGECLEYV